MKKYEGEKPCQGCGKSGKECPRIHINKLCDDCLKVYTIGKELRNDYRPEDYTMASAQWYKLRFYNHEHHGVEIEEAFFELLDAMARRVGFTSRVDLTDCSATTSSKSVIISKKYADALKKIVDALGLQQAELRDGFASVETQRKEVIANERNKIYNEGVAHGRSMLLQLNSGEITLADFEEKIVKY